MCKAKIVPVVGELGCYVGWDEVVHRSGLAAAVVGHRLVDVAVAEVAVGLFGVDGGLDGAPRSAFAAVPAGHDTPRKQRGPVCHVVVCRATLSDVDDLVTWLKEQLTEDERLALTASPSPWVIEEQPGRIHGRDFLFADITAADNTSVCDTESGSLGPELGTAWHIFHWEPRRVLAEVQAKLRILDAYASAVTFYDAPANRHHPAGEVHGLETAVRLLALPYADQPGYLEEWRP